MKVHTGEPLKRAGTPLEEARGAVILVHGRGATPENILELAGVLDRPDLAWMAPAAANRTWYNHSFMAEREKNEPHLSSALELLGSLVDQVKEKGIPLERTVLLGFSQGACLSSEFVYRNPGRYGGLVLFSGGLIGPPGTTWSTEGDLSGTPVFLGCSDVDAHIPVERVHATTRVLGEMGAQVTERIYPGMGHLVNRDEIQEARKLLDEAVPPPPERAGGGDSGSDT